MKTTPNNKNGSWMVTLGYLAWGIFVLFAIRGFLAGETGDDFGGFAYIFLPIIAVMFGVGMRGIPLPVYVSLFWMLGAVVVNFALIFIVTKAFLHLFRQSKVFSTIAILLTLLIPFGGSWLNGYRALFRHRYETVEECSKHGFPVRQYCHYVFAREDVRKRDLEKCRNLGTDSRGRCVSEVARYTNNVELCDIYLVNYNREREACIGQFAAELGGEGVCERIRGASNRYKALAEECYKKLAASRDDPKTCEKIPPISETGKGNDWLGFCLTQLAWAKQNIGLCHRIRQLSPISNEYYTCMKKFEQGHW